MEVNVITTELYSYIMDTDIHEDVYESYVISFPYIVHMKDKDTSILINRIIYECASGVHYMEFYDPEIAELLMNEIAINISNMARLDDNIFDSIITYIEKRLPVMIENIKAQLNDQVIVCWLTSLHCIVV